LKFRPNPALQGRRRKRRVPELYVKKGANLKTIGILALAAAVIAGSASVVHSAGPSDELARDAFRQILSQADTNRDGKLSLAECKAIYKDAAMAERNCTFWDVNKDGTITEDEYASQAMSMGKRK
jgi:hypothetical protein